MKKESFQDIVPARSREEKNKAIDNSNFFRPKEKIKLPDEGRPVRKRRWSLKIFITIGVLTILFFVLTSIYGTATVTFVPRTEKVDIVSTLTASLDGDGLIFQPMSIGEESISKLIPWTDKKEVARKARGKIYIFNEYNSSPQRLIDRTRFETPDGKIYRIPDSVVVPGSTVVDGKKKPGSVLVEVVADQPGEEYNIENSDFTVPGFKGDPRFEFFYARTNTPISGGFIGELKMVSDSARSNAQAELQSELKNQLIAKAQSSIPTNTIFFPELVLTNFLNDENQNPSGIEDMIEIIGSGTLSAFIFDKGNLAKSLANRVINDPQDGILIKNYSALSVKKAGGDFDPNSSEEIILEFTGSITFVWPVDQEALVKDLSDRDPDDYNLVFTLYPNVVHAETRFTPAWSRLFPSSPRTIKVEQQIE